MTDLPVRVPGEAGRPLSPLLLVGLFLVALVGRFELGRIGVEGGWGETDLRSVGIVVLATLVLAWRLHPRWSGHGVRFPSSVVAASGLIGYLALTAFWAPPGARVSDLVVDLTCLLVLVWITTVLTSADPEGACRFLLGASAAVGLVYALGGLLLGDVTVQGRIAFLGGGPNVYARVVALGLIAVVVLALVRRRALLLVPVVPVMVVAIALSGSRGAVAAGLTTVVVALLVLRRRIPVRVLVPAVVLSTTSAVVAISLLGGASLGLLRTRFISEIFGEGDYSGRPVLFGEALQVFAGHPLFGGGLDAFYVSYGYGVDLGYPHNFVLDVASTGGLVGLVVLAVVLVCVTRDLHRLGRPTAARLGLLFSAFFVVVQSLFSGDFYDTRFVWIFLAAALSGAAVGGGRAEGSSTSSSPLAVTR